MNGRKTESRKAKIVSAFINLFILILVFYIFFNFLLFFKCIVSFSKIPDNKTCEYLRIKIYGSSSSDEGNTVSASFSIIDSNGNEIAVIERSWKGNYLCVEFEKASYKYKTVMFPSKIYGKEKIYEENVKRRGTSLEKYYNDNGQCMLLGYGSSLKQRKALYNICVIATKKYPFYDFAISKNILIDLSMCKNDVYYSIVQNSRGELELQEL